MALRLKLTQHVDSVTAPGSYYAYFYPNAYVPVISMSVNPRLSAERLGTAI
ncbi:hypothetical protein AAC03nite_28570 [Alicyclobacillus acidoterrestris]|nr:hypothetical protein AAC03nite_28570 [Alicyclobacillus acidoterrestris]